MLQGCYRLLPSWTFTADSYQRVWRISGKEPVEVSLQHPDILSHNRLTLSFLSFSLSPSVPLLLPGFLFSKHMYLLEYRQCQIQILYSLFIFLVCVCGVHTCICVYICTCMHVSACECMCVHVYTCRVQKLTPDVFLMYPPSYSGGRLSHSNPEHTHTALTSLASQRSRALCLCLWCGTRQAPASVFMLARLVFLRAEPSPQLLFILRQISLRAQTGSRSQSSCFSLQSTGVYQHT